MFDESLKMQYFLKKIFIDVRKIANICCTHSSRLKIHINRIKCVCVLSVTANFTKIIIGKIAIFIT